MQVAAGMRAGAGGRAGGAAAPAAVTRAALDAAAARVVVAEMRRAILWFPVGLGAGIALYLGWRVEPVALALAAPLPAALALLLAPARRLWLRFLLVAALAVALGHAAAQLSSLRAAMPRLPGPVMSTVEGRVVWLDRAASGAPRVLLDHVTLFGRPAAATPERVRLTLSAVDRAEAPRPGDWIHVRARLGPPGAPVEPGGFDFARRAFFDRLGAIGYARSPPVRLPPAEVAGPRGRDLTGAHPFARWWAGRAPALARWRLDVADAVRARLPGAEGAFAAAILVGDRSAIEEADAEALRISTLAHLLAISGLHMGLLAGLVFTAVRAVLALAGPRLARLPGKKLAAGAALVAAAGYLMASGATVATQRAFVMAAVALVAVLLDRPALTLRAVALAAVIVLLWRPISLTGPGFQMSFAATVALIAAMEALRERRRARAADGAGAPATDPAAGTAERAPPTAGNDQACAPPATGDDQACAPPTGDGEQERAPPCGGDDAARVRRPPRRRRGRLARLFRRVATGFAMVALTSLVAGLATAPIAAIHFHRLGTWGLAANLLAVPVMGAWIAPAGAAAAIAAPFGLAGPLIDAMGLGIAWVLAVAHGVAALPGADRPVAALPVAGIAALALGGLWLALWRGGWRLAGAPALLAVLAVMPALAPERPAVLIAPGGGLVGVMTPAGRALDHPRSEGYAARVWLEGDGDRAGQREAALRAGFLPAMAAGDRRRPPTRRLRLTRQAAGTLEGWEVVVLRGRRDLGERVAAACGPGRIVIAPAASAPAAGTGCLFVGRVALAAGRALAVVPTEQGPLLLADAPRCRPWRCDRAWRQRAQ